MSITSLNSCQSLYKPSSAHYFRKISEDVTNPVTVKSDTVNLSNESKRLSQTGFYADMSDPKVKADLEALALPDWFISMVPKECLREGPMEEFKERPMYSGGNKKSIGYCASTPLKYLNEEREKTGISQIEAYNMKVSDPYQYAEYDEKLHQAVRNRLLADEQYVKYSNVLGITF